MKKGCTLISGSGLGGTSTINRMAYERGLPSDFNQWEKQGNPSWKWKEVIERYKCMENLRVSIADKIRNSSDYGHHGPVNLERFNHKGHVKTMYLNAAKELKINLLPDLEEKKGHQTGIVQGLGTFEEGGRQSAADAFLSLHRLGERPNLCVVRNTFVTKVILNKNNEATGVEYIRNKKTAKAYVKGEVIITAGTFGTPQILMRSGIGHETDLKKLNIKPLVNLPGVGKNYQDQMGVPIILTVNRPFKRDKIESDLLKLTHFYEEHDGPLSKSGLFSLYGFFKSSNLHEEQHPEIRIITDHYKKDDTIRIQTVFGAYGYEQAIITDLSTALKKTDLIVVWVSILQPHAKGEIQIENTKPYSTPTIIPNYLDNKHDMEILSNGITLYEKFLKTTAFRKHDIKMLLIHSINCKDHDRECYIRHLARPLQNAIGTAKMGPKKDKMSVVDNRLRVHDVKKLRVSDVSVVPDLPTGAPYALAYLIAYTTAINIQTENGQHKFECKQDFTGKHKVKPNIKVFDIGKPTNVQVKIAPSSTPRTFIQIISKKPTKTPGPSFVIPKRKQPVTSSTSSSTSSIYRGKPRPKKKTKPKNIFVIPSSTPIRKPHVVVPASLIIPKSTVLPKHSHPVFVLPNHNHKKHPTPKPMHSKPKHVKPKTKPTNVKPTHKPSKSYVLINGQPRHLPKKIPKPSIVVINGKPNIKGPKIINTDNGPQFVNIIHGKPTIEPIIDTPNGLKVFRIEILPNGKKKPVLVNLEKIPGIQIVYTKQGPEIIENHHGKEIKILFNGPKLVKTPDGYKIQIIKDGKSIIKNLDSLLPASSTTSKTITLYESNPQSETSGGVLTYSTSSRPVFAEYIPTLAKNELIENGPNGPQIVKYIDGIKISEPLSRPRLVKTPEGKTKIARVVKQKNGKKTLTYEDIKGFVPISKPKVVDTANGPKIATTLENNSGYKIIVYESVYEEDESSSTNPNVVHVFGSNGRHNSITIPNGLTSSELIQFKKNHPAISSERIIITKPDGSKVTYKIPPGFSISQFINELKKIKNQPGSSHHIIITNPDGKKITFELPKGLSVSELIEELEKILHLTSKRHKSIKIPNGLTSSEVIKLKKNHPAKSSQRIVITKPNGSHVNYEIPYGLSLKQLINELKKSNEHHGSSHHVTITKPDGNKISYAIPDGLSLSELLKELEKNLHLSSKVVHKGSKVVVGKGSEKKKAKPKKKCTGFFKFLCDL